MSDTKREIQLIKRNELGLLPNVEYIIGEDGRVDWRHMVSPEFLVFNLQYSSLIEEIYKKPISELRPTEVDEKYILILLAAFKELARLRGYISVNYNVVPVSEQCITATCQIKWLPNFETENRVITFSDGADANVANTSGFGKIFLTTVAVNRSFVRAVRNFLGINILGSDEIAAKATPNPSETIEPVETGNISVHAQLQRAIDSVGSSFQKIKAYSIKLNESASTWECLEDIPIATCFTLIGKLNNKSKKKE